jgi:formate dehydrogenase subunit beta
MAMASGLEQISMAVQQKALELLQSGEVDCVIGYGRGTLPYRVTPVFIDNVDEVGELTWNLFCVNNLATYLGDTEFLHKRVAVVGKACDVTSISRLLNDNQLRRENVVVIGVQCDGLIDPSKLISLGENKHTDYVEHGDGITIEIDGYEETYRKEDILYDKCLNCVWLDFEICDYVIGDRQERKHPVVDCTFENITQFEQLAVHERKAFWQAQFAKCIRCYACRNICPVCNCIECVFDQIEPEWVGKRTDVMDNMVFHITRLMHEVAQLPHLL